MEMSQQQGAAYFPGSINEHAQSWYASNLMAMNEDSLFSSDRSGSPHTLRFLWIAFNQPVLCIRLDWTSSKDVSVTVKRTDGNGGFDTGQLILNEKRTVSEQTFDELTLVFSSTNFWALPTTEALPMGTDGEEWIIEVVSIGRYHVIDRWTPQLMPRDQPIVTFVEQLMIVAGVDF